MVGHDNLSERRITTEDDVASLLLPGVEPGFLQGLDAFATGYGRWFHIATGVTGSQAVRTVAIKRVS
jgi:hypothetical protein